MSRSMTPVAYLISPPLCAAANMAVDETLLHAASRLATPILRLYSWTEPAATFGYFQHYSDIEHATHLRPLVRRPTGGGLVPHDADWTYSLVFPVNTSWYGLRATQSYARVHAWIVAAFAKLEVKTELAPCCRTTLPGQCFAGYEKDDVLWNGRKIAGAAQRRTREGLLIQGSVQPPPLGLGRADWEKSMFETGQELEEFDWKPIVWDNACAEMADRLQITRYSQDVYNRKR